MGGLALLGALAVLVPGIAVYLGLRSLGLGIGPAGLVGLLLEFIGCIAYCGWLFGGGRRATTGKAAPTVATAAPSGTPPAGETP